MSQRRIVLIPQVTISVALANIIGPTYMLPKGFESIAVQARFLYGAGGTNVTAYVQTSLDNSDTWADIMCFQWTTAAATKVSAVHGWIALAAAVTVTDGSLTANTILNGLIGDRIRVKWTSTGTYSGATKLNVDAVVN